MRHLWRYPQLLDERLADVTWKRKMDTGYRFKAAGLKLPEHLRLGPIGGNH